MNKRIVLCALLLTGLPAMAEEAAPKPVETAAPAAEPALDPALAWLGRLAGGRWVCTIKTPEREMLFETRYEKVFNGRGVRVLATLDKGAPGEVQSEALFGWDPVQKNVYYFDFHGDRNVFKGTARVEGGKLVSEFERIVGPPAKWRATDEMPDEDTLVFTIQTWKDGAWTKAHEPMTFKRVRG